MAPLGTPSFAKAFALSLFAAAMSYLAPAPAQAQTFTMPAMPRTRLVQQPWTTRYNNEEENDLGLWPQSQLIYRRKKLLLELDVNPRLQFRITRLNELQLRTFVGYQVKPWMQLWVGAYPFSPVFEPNYTNETRLLQQISMERARGRVAGSLRTRLEQRWLGHTNDKMASRIRIMPRLNYFIDKKESMYVFVANELFINFNTINRLIRTGIAQNRLYGGAGMRINRHMNLEVAYLNQWIHRRYHVNNQPNRFNHNIVINVITNFR